MHCLHRHTGFLPETQIDRNSQKHGGTQFCLMLNKARAAGEREADNQCSSADRVREKHSPRGMSIYRLGQVCLVTNGAKSSTRQSEEDQEEADPEYDAADYDRGTLADEEQRNIFNETFCCCSFCGFC